MSFWGWLSGSDKIKAEQDAWRERNAWQLIKEAQERVLSKNPDAICHIYLPTGGNYVSLECFDASGKGGVCGKEIVYFK
jgi:hypothetical protein